MQKSRFVFALVVVCFLVSGAAGLAYQLAWMRYLALFLGHTSYAVVAVLVAFMGGLAIGNALFGIWADKSSKPLALYGWLELGIALYGLAFPTYYTFCHDAYIGLMRSWQPAGAAALTLKFGFSLAAILLPAMLMGATLPVLTRFVTQSLGELREKVAALYFINSAGAVAGCIIADFWWLPTYGLEFTVFGAAGLNFIAGALALALSIKTRENAVAVEEAPSPGVSEETYTQAELNWAVAGIGVSGFVAMLYEVAWTRMLALALGSSTHAFSLMLITFISGIAAGAWIIYRWRSLKNTLRAFAWAELALAGAVFFSMFFYELLPYWFGALASMLARKPNAYPIYQMLQAFICFGVMFIPSLCLGLTLPLVSRVATKELSRSGRSVGRVFSVNTLGTVLGTLVTGLVLMPYFGLARTFAFGVALNALIGLGILGRAQLSWRSLIVAPAFVAGLMWIAGLMFDQNWRGGFSLGLWRWGEFNMTRKDFKESIEALKPKFARDGAGSTVVVYQEGEGEKANLALRVNGKVDAGTSLDVPMQRLSGHVPMLLRPQSERVLVVGLGSGMTAAAVARHSSVKQVDVVEISPEVVEAARLFEKHNDQVHDNPRVRIAIDDAKSFLKAGTNAYDIIISEPSNPWMAGVSGVFSREYYESCQARLRRDGLMVQWVQIYETNDEILQLVLRTFTMVFPHLNIWRPAISDLVLIGSAVPFQPDLDAFLKRYAEREVKADMDRMELDRPLPLLACEVISGQNGPFAFPPEGPVHSDFFPELEFRAQKAFFVQRGASEWSLFDENYSSRPTTLLGEYLKRYKPVESDLRALARFHITYRVPDAPLLVTVLHRWRRDFPSATVPIQLSTHLSEHGTTDELEAQRYRVLLPDLLAKAASDPEPLRLYAGYLLKTYRAQRSALNLPASEELEKVLQRLVETDVRNERVYNLYRAEMAWDRGDDEACISIGLKALALNPETPPNAAFAVDLNAPIPALRRVIDSLVRGQRWKEALEMSRYATFNGYAKRNANLAALCRKVEAITSAGR